jgi:hypothetical protein
MGGARAPWRAPVRYAYSKSRPPSHACCPLTACTHFPMCQRIARKYVLVVDIDPAFEPSEMMLSGEPYVIDYLAHMDKDVEAAANYWRKSKTIVVADHVVMWRIGV